MTNRYIIYGMQVLWEHTWVRDHAVVVEQGLIKAIIPDNMLQHHLPAHVLKYPTNHYLIPGLIDLHVHGAQGYDVMDGTEKSLLAISQSLAQEGVTGFLATTMTTKNAQIEKVIAAVRAVMPKQAYAAIMGIHLEGPFISADKAGAQRAADTQPPDPRVFAHWYKIADGAIKRVTLAPELPGSIQLIQSLKQWGITTSIGHSNATYQETMAGISAGCTSATHLFNAMRQMAQREPGVVGACLLSDAIDAEVIVDGFHLHPAMVNLTYRLKGKDRLLLVTDAILAKCLPAGQHEVYGEQVTVEGGKATLADGRLFGSTLTMNQAMINMMQFVNCSFIDAIQMASLNPARTLGLSDRKGTIAVEKDADLVILDQAKQVCLTMRGGQVVYKKDDSAKLKPNHDEPMLDM